MFPVGMLLLVLSIAPRRSAADLETALAYAESLKGAPYGWWSGGAIPAVGAASPRSAQFQSDLVACCRAGLGIERARTLGSHCGDNQLLLCGDPEPDATQNRSLLTSEIYSYPPYASYRWGLMATGN